MSFELREDYATEVEFDETHDISEGFKRHFPIEYSRTGRHRTRTLSVPWAWIALAVGVVMVWRGL